MPDFSPQPLREITGRNYFRPKSAPIGTGSVELTLSCGHHEFRKRSRDPGLRARCWACHTEALDV